MPLRPTIPATSTKNARTSPRYRCVGPTTTPPTPRTRRPRGVGSAAHDLPPGTLGHEYVDFDPAQRPRAPGRRSVVTGSVRRGRHAPCHRRLRTDRPGRDRGRRHDGDRRHRHPRIAAHRQPRRARGRVPRRARRRKEATLARPGAAATLADAIRRGEQCTGDFTTADHLAMVGRPLADVRLPSSASRPSASATPWSPHGSLAVVTRSGRAPSRRAPASGTARAATTRRIRCS